MKCSRTLRAFLASLIVIVFAASIVRAACTKEYLIFSPVGGSYAWNGFLDANCDCPTAGNNCFVTITCDNVNVVSNGPYWHVEGHVSQRLASINAGSLGQINRELSHQFVFPPGLMSFAADECGVHPSLQLSLQGVATNADGTFSVDLPK